MRTRWVRGPSTLPEVFQQPRGSKLKLIWEDNRPVGPKTHPSKFSESLGVIIAKGRRCDWTKHWEEKSENAKDSLWKEITSFWELDETKKEIVLDKLSSNVFRSKKCKWKKKHYTRHSTYEERVSDKPPQLTQQEWVDLVQFWDSPGHNVLCDHNKENRSNQVVVHTTGRTTFDN